MQKFTGRVLIVDDDPTNLTTTQFMFDAFGLETHLAEDGHEAVDQYIQMSSNATPDGKVYHLIIMDHQMPEMNGDVATSKIRAFERERGLEPSAIIGYTGKTESEDREIFMASGLTEWKAKPTRLQEWLPLFEKYCGHAPEA